MDMDVVSVLSKLASFDDIVTDSPVFRIHYRVVTLLLLCFGLVSTYDLYYGRPIACFTAKSDDFPADVINDVCWANGTMTFPTNDSTLAEDEMPVKVGYYRWVGFFLILQCIILYLPHYCWLFFEHHRMEQLVGKLQSKVSKEERLLLGRRQRVRRRSGPERFVSIEDDDESKDEMTAFLKRYFHPSRHRLLRIYAIEYLMCEAMNLLCVIGMLVLTNAFLHGELHHVAAEAFRFTDDDFNMDGQRSSTVFPRLVRCSFNGIDESGRLIPKQALCVLSESTMNEFIFSFLWLAYVWLLVLDCVTVVYRVAFVCSLQTRRFILGRYCSCIKSEYVDAVAYHCDLSEFFIIFLLADNLGPGHFMRVLKEMAKIKRGCFELESPVREINDQGDIGSFMSSSDGAINSK